MAKQTLMCISADVGMKPAVAMALIQRCQSWGYRWVSHAPSCWKSCCTCSVVRLCNSIILHMSCNEFSEEAIQAVQSIA